MRKKNGARRIKLPDFRLHYNAIVLKTVMVSTPNRNIDQWNRIESLDINPHTSGHLIYDKRRIYKREKTVSSVGGAGKIG